MLSIIAIGKKHEPWVHIGIERYAKRLSRAWQCEWILLPHSTAKDGTARQDESHRILSRINDTDFVILLDEHGKTFTSPALSQQIETFLGSAHRMVFIIGGAYGVNEALTRRANLIWSLSSLVFPHQLVRLILIEQLYRAQTIANGHPYHHS